MGASLSVTRPAGDGRKGTAMPLNASSPTIDTARSVSTGTLVHSKTATTTTWKQFSKQNALYRQIERICTSPEEIELCQVLDDPVGQKYLGAFAKSKHSEEILYCFIEIIEYNIAPSSSYRKSKAMVIYKKYIREGAVMALGGITKQISEDYEARIKNAKNDYTKFNDDFFQPVLRLCFLDLCQHTWFLFKESPEYHTYKTEMKDTYNKVMIEDFEYLEIIGSGGFGRVVHAKKKTTDKHYAMKIQLKTALLEEYSSDLSQITTEKVILEACNHPYIVEMHYGFQTAAHAIIVLAYVRGGDLGELLKASAEWRLPEDQVRLYAAEIALALTHLHEMGILYRDLKPGNVLLGEDGHIKLADMGLATTAEVLNHRPLSTDVFHTPVFSKQRNKSAAPSPRETTMCYEDLPMSPFMDEKEKEKQKEKESSSCSVNNTDDPNIARKPTSTSPEGTTTTTSTSTATTTTTTTSTSPTPSTNNSRKPSSMKPEPTYASNMQSAKFARRKTTVGTRGYMAPELLRGKLKRREERKGYNLSVDYWALGITVYELLCGRQPFEHKVPMIDFFGNGLMEQEEHHLTPKQHAEMELEKMSRPAEYPPYVSPEARDFVTRLLDINEETRLGCTKMGFQEILDHPFFNDIDWEKLLAKHIEPAHKPMLKPLLEKKKFNNFEAMLECFNQKEGESKYNWTTPPDKKDQMHFQNWDYVSPTTLKAELGMAMELDESNRPFKVLQLTGQLPNQ